MTRPPQLADLLDHVLAAIDRIDEFTTDMDELVFLADRKTQDAVIRNLEIVGEACARLRRTAATWVEQHSEIPWGSAIGNRNALAHGYFSVDLRLVWATLKDDLPDFRRKIASARSTVE